MCDHRWKVLYAHLLGWRGMVGKGYRYHGMISALLIIGSNNNGRWLKNDKASQSVCRGERKSKTSEHSQHCPPGVRVKEEVWLSSTVLVIVTKTKSIYCCSWPM